MTTILIIAAAWVGLSILTGLGLGKAIRIADDKEGTRE